MAKVELSALIDLERLLVECPALTFYTDGSGIDKHIGAAAVNPDIGATRRKYVGTEPEYTVYSGELDHQYHHSFCPLSSLYQSHLFL